MQLILFDCDGTLVDSQALIHGAMTRAFAAMGHAPPERTRTLSVVGLSLPEAMAHMLPQSSPAPQLAPVEAHKTAAITLREETANPEPFLEAAGWRAGSRHVVVMGASAEMPSQCVIFEQDPQATTPNPVTFDDLDTLAAPAEENYRSALRRHGIDPHR